MFCIVSDSGLFCLFLFYFIFFGFSLNSFGNSGILLLFILFFALEVQTPFILYQLRFDFSGNYTFFFLRLCSYLFSRGGGLSFSLVLLYGINFFVFYPKKKRVF